jgi:hypothetical protein
VKRRLLGNRLVRQAYRAWWERKYKVTKDDVYPRSGNTWVRFMLLQARPDFSENDFHHIEEIIPDMHGPMPWFQCPRANVVKSHLTYWQPFRRVIYLVRDGWNATYSNWRYQSEEGGYSGSLDAFLKHSHWPSSWSSHVSGWVNAAETIQIVRYEDLIRDPVTQLTKIAEVLRWNVATERLKEIVANSSKSRMRVMERTRKIRLHRVGGDGPRHYCESEYGQLKAEFVAHLSPVSKSYLSES